jgi:DNA polymerase-3 subunit gamma/tau
MDYIAFALKYRPKNFEEVIGQDHVVLALKTAILKKHIHHAYLFSGPRGTGKTSLARIFAKCFNCESSKEPVVKPCEKCPSCLEITKSSSLDIIEIDGASNRGIDEIRTLRENVKLSPAHSRFKVYIIDEVHQITSDGFNALLKTLEEPPAHVKFIFATTHPHKVPATILSRCQKFQFSLVSLEKIADKLHKITKAEKLNIDDSLLYAIARAAGGSIRDAESLLDQLAPVISDEGSIKDVFSFLGIIDEDTLINMLKYIVAKDLASSLSFVDKIIKDGKDLGTFLNALIEYMRNLLLSKVSPKSFKELTDISPQAKELISKLSESIPIPEILKIIDLLIEAKELSHKLNTVRVPFELALVKFSYQEDLQLPKKEPIKPIRKDSPKTIHSPKHSHANRIEDDKFDNSGEDKPEPVKGKQELSAGIDNSNLGQTLPKPPASDSKQESLGLIDIDTDSLGVTKEDSQTLDVGEKEQLESDNILLPEMKAKWQEIISHIQKIRAAIAAHLFLAQPLSSSGNVLTIAFSSRDYFHKEIAEANKNLQFIERVISEIIGKTVIVKFILSESIPSQAVNISHEFRPQAQSEENTTESSGASNEIINELLDSFGGKLHTDDE